MTRAALLRGVGSINDWQSPRDGAHLIMRFQRGGYALEGLRFASSAYGFPPRNRVKLRAFQPSRSLEALRSPRGFLYLRSRSANPSSFAFRRTSSSSRQRKLPVS
jgi:hypothetical protein